MKHLTPLFAFAFIFASASAAVPLHWTVETSRATPAQFEAYQGETLALEAALQSYGKPLEAPSNYSLYWQTNGMGSTYWSVPCPVPTSSLVGAPTNVLFATWFPTNDVGAKVYNCFIGQPGTIYHAAFQLRLRPSPGATPNELPLPQKVIDFAKVTVLNPPWSGGGGGGVDTNAVIDIIHDTVSGSARPLPKYLHLYNADDSYPDAAAEYYRSRGDGKTDGGCSSVRDGGFLYRNFDYPFDDRAEFVVKMSAGKDRFASVGVAQVGTNLTEQIVTSGKWSKWYKSLPGATVDGINENGVACNINVVDGDPHWEGGASPALHPLAAVRWILDNATNAQSAAEYIASHIAFPQVCTQNFHYMIADETATYIVENGDYHSVTGRAVMTNFPLYPAAVFGSGWERYQLLTNETASITNVWFTRAYLRSTTPYWYSEFHSDDFWYVAVTEWAKKPKEEHRGESFDGESWWQSVHTTEYDFAAKTMKVAVQEIDDWYTFAVGQANVETDDTVTRTSANPVKSSGIWSAIWGALTALPSGFSSLYDWCVAKLSEKRDKTDRAVYSVTRTENTDWTWTSENAELEEALREVKPVWEDVWNVYPDGFSYFGDPVHDYDRSTVILQGFFLNDSTGESYIATARRPRYMDETLGPAKTNQQLAAVATDDTAKPADGDLMKYDAENDRFVKAVEGTDYLKTHQDISGKRDLMDNTCHKTEFGGEWTYTGVPQNTEVVDDPQYSAESPEPWGIALREISTGIVFYAYSSAPENAASIVFTSSLGFSFTATRSAVCTKDKRFVTEDVVDGKVSSAVSTNNPEFVSAVRNTPTSGMPENMPTDWGTYGTVGAALAALAAFVKWAKAKIVAVIGDDGKPTDDFATNLLGKQVAKDAIAYKVATDAGENRSVLAVEIDGTETGDVNVIVPAPEANKVIDFEVWVKVAAGVATIPQINFGRMVEGTYTPVALIKKGGENPAYEKDATSPVTNILHFTAKDASGYTVIAAAFK